MSQEMRNGKPLIRLGLKTMKQANYVAGVLEGKTKADAARDAGYTESSARSPSRNIENATIRAIFQKAMQAAVPIDLFVKKQREGIDAMLVKTATFEGHITDERHYVDFETRRGYLKDIAEFAGYHIPKAEIDVNDSTADTETQLDELVSLAVARRIERADSNGEVSIQESAQR